MALDIRCIAMSLGEQFPTVLTAARTGAEWALTAIYRDLNPSLLRYLRTMEPGEFEDLASQTWMDVAVGLHRFAGQEDDFRRWLFTIARRRLIDLQRRAWKHPTSPIESVEDPVAPEETEAEVLDRLSLDSVLHEVRKLTPEQADVVLLRIVGGFTAAEVAQLMGKRPGAIRVLQHRALAQLARNLSAAGTAARSAEDDGGPEPLPESGVTTAPSRTM